MSPHVGVHSGQGAQAGHLRAPLLSAGIEGEAGEIGERGAVLGAGACPRPEAIQGAGGCVPWPRASVAPVGRDQRQEGLGPRPRTSCTRGGGPRSGDSLSSPITLYGSRFPGLHPAVKGDSHTGRGGERGSWRGGSVNLVCSMWQDLQEVCFIHCFVEPIQLPHATMTMGPISQMEKLRPREERKLRPHKNQGDV